jgi:succinate-semialdehyde dehydrogenase / glutarate-semialdehyde dehydrogenase
LNTRRSTDGICEARILQAARLCRERVEEMGGGHDPRAGQADAQSRLEICISPTRFFVQEAVYDRFTRAFGERAAAMKIGDGLDPLNQMGPLANDRRLAAMEMLVADATRKGARIVAGGSRIGNRGYFYPLAVLADVPDDARGCKRSRLAARVADPGQNGGRSDRKGEFAALRARRLRIYAIGVDCRSAGGGNRGRQVVDQSPDCLVRRNSVRGVKDSGYGREGGTEGLECYTVAKNVSHLVL